MTELVSRRDFLKLAGLGAATTAVLTGCGPLERYAASQEINPFPLDALKDLNVSCPLSNIERSGSLKTTMFGPSHNDYRVVEFFPSEVGVFNPIEEFTPLYDQARAAEIALSTTLSQYERIVTFQRRVVDIVSGNEQWVNITAPDSLEITRESQVVADELNEIGLVQYLNPDYQQPLNNNDPTLPTMYDLAVASITYTMFENSDLTDPQRYEIITKYIDPNLYPDIVQRIINKSKRYAEAKVILSPLPPDLPIKAWADLHLAHTTPVDNILEAYTNEELLVAANPAWKNSIFVPKTSKEVKRALEHTSEKEFIEIDPKPIVDILTYNDSDGRRRTKLLITHDPQISDSKYNRTIDILDEVALDLRDMNISNVDRSTDDWLLLTMLHPDLYDILAQQPANLSIQRVSQDTLPEYFIPNKFTGSPKLFDLNPNARIAAGFPLIYKGESRMYLLGKTWLDNNSTINEPIISNSHWLTKITHITNRARNLGIKYLSKVGLLAPQEYFVEVMRGISSLDGSRPFHNLTAPRSEAVRDVLLEAYRANSEAEKHPGDLNWLAVIENPNNSGSIPVFTIRPATDNPILAILNDDIVATPLQEKDGTQATLNPGALIEFSDKIVKDDGGNEYYVIGVNDDTDKGRVIVVKSSDALTQAIPIDSDNNIIDGILNTLTIGAIAGGVYATLYAPTLIPGIMLTGSTRISAKYFVMSNWLKLKGQNALRQARQFVLRNNP